MFKILFLSVMLIVSAVASSKAVIVFDASGSMWGQIGGKAKITIAKDALKDVVKNWNDSVELGVMAYGHRRKGDCNDIEMISPISQVDKNGIISKVMAISPKGKTPISRALKKAADKLQYTEDKATIILISDGQETCDSDPCVVAKELEAKGIDFVTHVIGFNVDKKTSKQLSCIAKVTGGEYFSAKNAKELNKAIKTVAKKVQKAKPKPKPKPKVKKLDHTVEVTASESEGGKWIDADCRIYNEDRSDRWYIYPSKKEPGTKYIPVGKYTLNCEYNAFKKKDIPFEVKAGETTKVHVVMGQTGKVEVSASESEGGKWIDADCRAYNEDRSDSWGIYPRKKEPSIKQIPVGKYTLNCEYNAFKKKDIPFEVKAGETTKVHVVMGQTGKVEVSASESEGGKWIDADCRAYNEDRSDSWGIYPRKKEPSIKQIPVGKYTLNCEYNAFKKKDIPFEVKAGETTKVHVVMGQTGKVEVSASESEGGKWIDADCRAYNEDRSDSWGIYPRKKEPSIKQIPVGKYTLNCEYNAFKKKDIPFEVKAGEITKVHVVFVSFLINTKCEGKVNYEIYAPNGQLVFEKSGIECDKPLKVTLNPGTYTVSVTQDDNTKEQKFTIGGDSSSLTIDLTKQEPTKEELIKADTPQESKAKEKIADKKVQQDIQDMNNDIQEAKKMIEMMNSMLNPNANQKPQQKTTDDDMSVDDTEFFTK